MPSRLISSRTVQLLPLMSKVALGWFVKLGLRHDRRSDSTRTFQAALIGSAFVELLQHVRSRLERLQGCAQGRLPLLFRYVVTDGDPLALLGWIDGGIQ